MNAIAAQVKSMVVSKAKEMAITAVPVLFMPDPPPEITPKPPLPMFQVPGKLNQGAAALAASASQRGSQNSAVSVASPPPGANPTPSTVPSNHSPGTDSKHNSSETNTAPPSGKTDADFVDVNLNDLFHTFGALAMLPAGVLLRAVAAVYPGILDDLNLDETSFGTGDRDGLGIIFGNNSSKKIKDPKTGKEEDNKDLPGILGLSMSLAHLFSGEKEFEAGQDAHDNKTGPGQKSSDWESIGDTIGQGLGILSRKIGVGDSFYQLIVTVVGPDDNNYGLTHGVGMGALTPPSKDK